jgi:hypothetical protein
VEILAEWAQVLPTVRIDRAHSDRARSASRGSICPLRLPKGGAVSSAGDSTVKKRPPFSVAFLFPSFPTQAEWQFIYSTVGRVTVTSDFAERDGASPGVCIQKAGTDWRKRQPLPYSRKQEGHRFRWPSFFTSPTSRLGYGL